MSGLPGWAALSTLPADFSRGAGSAGRETVDIQWRAVVNQAPSGGRSSGNSRYFESRLGNSDSWLLISSMTIVGHRGPSWRVRAA